MTGCCAESTTRKARRRSRPAPGTVPGRRSKPAVKRPSAPRRSRNQLCCLPGPPLSGRPATRRLRSRSWRRTTRSGRRTRCRGRTRTRAARGTRWRPRRRRAAASGRRCRASPPRSPSGSARSPPPLARASTRPARCWAGSSTRRRGCRPATRCSRTSSPTGASRSEPRARSWAGRSRDQGVTRPSHRNRSARCIIGH
uniref:Uncharacterized protein n=1 Tax=Arundo donax TaxID=35708 RepID=A0A0A9DHY9_ARUDO